MEPDCAAIPRKGSIVGAYIADLVERTDLIRLPSLFACPRADAEYQMLDRHGVSVVALRTDRLGSSELDGLLAFRLANYLTAGLVDPSRVFQEQFERDPPSSVLPADIHVVAGCRQTGRLVAYLALRTAGEQSTALLADWDRPLFPVEQAFGRETFQHLRLLRDLPIARVVELARYVKNQRLGASNELGCRGAVEVGVALFHVLCDSPEQRWAALVGDYEERVAKRNLDFFHFPSVVVRDIALAIGDDGFLAWAARTRAFVPFASLVADIALQRDRANSIEAALELPSTEAIRALVALRASTCVPRSGLDRSTVMA